MSMSIAGIAIVLALWLPPLHAQYDRLLYSGKGESHDISSSHPLSYWTADPLARDEGGDLCLGCKTDQGKFVGKQDYDPKVEVNRLGSLAGREIVELVYRIRGDVPEFGTNLVWRIVLVGTTPYNYAEIYHLQNDVGAVTPQKPSRIVNLGSESILATYDLDSGNGGGCWEGYWWFDRAGPHPVDFSPVYKAIGNQTPKNSTFTTGCWTIDLDKREIHTGVQKIDAECHACGQLGTATADFEMIHGVANPTKVEFSPDSDQ
jgi:hypothetical protein